MENLYNIRMLEVCAQLCEFAGESTNHASVKLILFRAFSCCVILLVVACIFINFFMVRGELYIKTLQALFQMTQLYIKVLLFIWFKHNIKKILIDIVQRFWDYKRFNRDIMKATEMHYKIVTNIQKLMVLLTCFMCFALLLWSVFDSTHIFIFETYIPNSNTMVALVLISQYYCPYFGYPYVISFDVLYLSLCVHVVLQIRLLKDKLKSTLNSSTKNMILEINYCIKHQQFLFGLFYEMKQLYSAMLFLLYFILWITTSTVLYEILTGHINLINYMMKLSMVFFYFCEFAFYAFPAEMVSAEFSDISDAVYMSRWYNNHVATQKIMLYIILNSQRVHYFSGAGIIDINVDAFGSIVRKSFSFCAVIQNLLKK